MGKNDGLKTKLFRKRRLAGLPTIQSLKTKFFVLPVHFLLRLMPGIILNYLRSLVFRTGKNLESKQRWPQTSLRARHPQDQLFEDGELHENYGRQYKRGTDRNEHQKEKEDREKQCYP